MENEDYSKEKEDLSDLDCGGDGGTAKVEDFIREEAGDVVSSDVSDSGDSSSSVSDEDDEERLLESLEREETSSNSESSSPEVVGIKRTAQTLSLSRGRRILSFSDEIPGQSLEEVRYVGEKVSVPQPLRVRSSSLLTRPPTRSAMKKSSSFPSSNSTLSKRSALTSSSFVPSGIVGGKGGGVVMPSGGAEVQQGVSIGSSGNKKGYVSPQWGWYISTTPPTPEHYYASGKGKPGKKQAKVAEDRLPPSVAEGFPMPVFKNSPTPVFRKNGAKDVFGNDNLGWPSVPL